MKKLKSVTALALGALCFSVFGVGSAEARTCIWNKAGFILNIAWVKDGQVVGVDKRTLGTGVCSFPDDDYPYTVILSVEGGKIANEATKGAINLAGAALGLIHPGAGVAGAGVASMLSGIIPDSEGIFYTGTPSQDRFLDVWGTIWNPQTGPGGPASTSGSRDP